MKKKIMWTLLGIGLGLLVLFCALFLGSLNYHILDPRWDVIVGIAATAGTLGGISLLVDFVLWLQEYLG